MPASKIIEEYKGLNIRQDLTVRKPKFYTVVPGYGWDSVVWGGSPDIVKRKVDKAEREIQKIKRGAL